MNKKTLIIMGSHRQTGFSQAYVKKICEYFNANDVSYELLDITKLHIQHCLGCHYCEKHFKTCVLKDDMDKVYDLLKVANHLIVVSPVYFNGVTSRLKVLIDRMQMPFMCKVHHGKPYTREGEAMGTAQLVSFGGAKSYKGQFEGIEENFKWVFNSLHLNCLEHIKFEGTDRLEKGVLTDTMLESILEMRWA